MTDQVGTRGRAVRDKIEQQTRRSQQAQQKGADLLALEVVPTFWMPTPIYLDAVEGARVTDVDGNEYIDLSMGFGPHLLGHRPRVVEEALREQLSRGWHFGLHSTLQAQLAELLQEATPSAELAVFCNSGTEATMYGMRLARGFTGKQRVALFDGSYHGAHDYALIKDDPESPRHAPEGKILGYGVPGVIPDTVVILPYRHEAAFDLIRKHKDELATVLVQPVQNHTPRIDNHEFLHELRRVCDECEVLLLIDEVVTGFRLAFGGGQEYYGVTADLATHGKALGGGMPIGSLSGKREIMKLLSKGFGDPDGVFSGGTFSGNPATMTAAVAAVRHMRDHKDEIYPYLMEQGNRLAKEVNAFCREHEMGATLMNAGSIFYMHFKSGDIEGARDTLDVNQAAEREFYLHLLGRGILVPGIHLFFISTAHTPADIDTVIEAFQESLLDVRADGLL